MVGHSTFLISDWYLITIVNVIDAEILFVQFKPIESLGISAQTANTTFLLVAECEEIN